MNLTPCDRLLGKQLFDELEQTLQRVPSYLDFSVVLFRSDFMLFSEKNRMKVHKNQWVLTMPCPLERLSGATSRVQTMVPEVQTPSQ
jgi:hypothetical protein